MWKHSRKHTTKSVPHEETVWAPGPGGRMGQGVPSSGKAQFGDNTDLQIRDGSGQPETDDFSPDSLVLGSSKCFVAGDKARLFTPEGSEQKERYLPTSRGIFQCQISAGITASSYQPPCRTTQCLTLGLTFHPSSTQHSLPGFIFLS